MAGPSSSALDRTLSLLDTHAVPRLRFEICSREYMLTNDFISKTFKWLELHILIKPLVRAPSLGKVQVRFCPSAKGLETDQQTSNCDTKQLWPLNVVQLQTLFLCDCWFKLEYKVEHARLLIFKLNSLPCSCPLSDQTTITTNTIRRIKGISNDYRAPINAQSLVWGLRVLHIEHIQ